MTIFLISSGSVSTVFLGVSERGIGSAIEASSAAKITKRYFSDFAQRLQKITDEFLNEECMENLCQILNVEPHEFLPHYVTVNAFLSRLETGELSFLGIPVVLREYSNTVVPIILTVWVTKYISGWLDKVIPSLLKSIFVPFLTLLICVPLGIIIIGPIAMILQNSISALVQLLISLNTGIAGLVVGAIWSILVMFGLHWAVIPFFAINIAQYGYDIINPLIFAGALASMGTCFLSAGIGGMIAGFSGSKLYAFGASGIWGTPCFINPNGIDGGFIGLMAGAAIDFACALVSALVLGAKKDAK